MNFLKNWNKERVLKYFKISFIIIAVLFFGFILKVILKNPSHDKNWWKSLEVLPSVSLINDEIEIKGVRNWAYDKDGPIYNSKEWVDKKYNINDLEGVWFFFVPFSENKKLAHTMLSFDFKDREPLSISIEARKEFGENYKLVDGFLNEYEIIYIWGTERDFVGDRIFSRGDTVYMYPLDVSKEFAQELLIDLFKRTNEIFLEPEFYNTLVNNCTNDLAKSANRIEPGTIPMSLARILPGYSFDLLFDLGYIKDGGDKETVRNKYNITDKAKNTTDISKLSENIRKI